MPAWVFFSYLALAFASLAAAIGRAERRPEATAVYRCVGALLGALILMVPLFYLVYLGMLPPGGNRVALLALNLLLPLAWAHLAVHAYGTGRNFWQRYAVGLTFFLTVPIMFIGVAIGAILWSRYAVPLADWALLLAGIVLWQKHNTDKKERQ